MNSGNNRMKKKEPQPIFPRMPSEAEIKREIRHEFGDRSAMRPNMFEEERETEENTEKPIARFTQKQLADGFRMSIILSPPVSKQRLNAQKYQKR